MRLSDSFETAFEALLAHKLRTFLSLLGVVIGVFAVTTLISLGEIATYGIKKDLEKIAAGSVFVQPRFEPGAPPLKFQEEDLELLSALPAKVIPYVLASATARDERNNPVHLRVLGVPGDFPKLDPSIELASGRFFTAAELKRAAPVVVLNALAKDRLFARQNPLGKPLVLDLGQGRRARAVVVGITKPASGVFASLETPQVYAPYTWLWRQVPWIRPGEFHAFELKAHPGVDPDALARRVKRLFELRYGEDRVEVQNIAVFTETLKGITLALQALLGGIGALSLLVGGIGIMNIMLVSVTERTREIGLRKALGATAGEIRTQFLIEATLLTLTGGVLGVLLAAVVLALLVAAVPFFEAFILSPKTVALALSVSALVGLFFGVWPADQAARLDPIQALRHE